MSRKKNIDLIDGDLDIKKAKVKISTWMDGDLLEAIREETEKETGSAKGYQTYLHQRSNVRNQSAFLSTRGCEGVSPGFG